MIRVLIADDHTIVRHGLRQILSSEQDMAVSAEAQNGQEVLDIVRRERVDVVVLDISMPGRNGLETLKELKRHHPGIAVIVLSMHPKDQYAVRVIKQELGIHYKRKRAVRARCRDPKGMPGREVYRSGDRRGVGKLHRTRRNRRPSHSTIRS